MLTCLPEALCSDCSWKWAEEARAGLHFQLVAIWRVVTHWRCGASETKKRRLKLKRKNFNKHSICGSNYIENNTRFETIGPMTTAMMMRIRLKVTFIALLLCVLLNLDNFTHQWDKYKNRLQKKNHYKSRRESRHSCMQSNGILFCV